MGGEVTVFDLKGHARAKRAYAWGYLKDEAKPERGYEITTVLQIPPVTSPQTAVKVAIAAAGRKA